MQFTIIKNPNKLLMKYEVWYKGESNVFDSNSQLIGTKNVCEVAINCFTLKGAQEFIAYRTETRDFMGLA